MEGKSNIESINNQEHTKEVKSFSELADYFAEQYPEVVEISAMAELELLSKSRQRDEAVERKGLLAVLDAHNISAENIKEINDGKWSIPYKDSLKEDLPEGYAFKGGAARYYLCQSLGLETVLPRDYDVVRISEAEPYSGADKEIAEKFMPKDFEFGDGVEFITDIDRYFNTRDLTINEVLATKTEIIATESAILDMVRNIIRLTSFERDTYNDYGEAGPKMLAKILRFYSEAIQLNGNAPSILDIGHNRIDEVSISPFWLAVNLDRAFERGREYASRYIKILAFNNQLPDDVYTTNDAVKYLLECMWEGSFVFRSAPADVFQEEDLWSEGVQDKEYERISKIRKKIIKR